MAFIDIQDPIKREETVQDYIKNLKEIRQRKEDEKVRGISQRQNIEKVFQPVVQATEKSASKITSEIKNLKKEEPEKEPKLERTIERSSQALDYYLNVFDTKQLDQYFGIYKKDDKYMMGDKEIKVDEYNNIFIDNTSIKGTKGLWRLIMMKTPETYEQEDLENYVELLNRTHALNIPNKTEPSQKPGNTSKWKFLKHVGIVNDEPESDEYEDPLSESEDKKEGEGVSFLPGNIEGLLEQFRLLFAEFCAGNKSSTKKQMVAILDQLLKRGYLNQDEYNAMCEKISC